MARLGNNNNTAQQTAFKQDWFLFVSYYYLTVLVYKGSRYIHVTINPIILSSLLILKKLFRIENQFLILTIRQRRGPIAAEFAGPGPAAITLPTLFGSKFP